MTTDEDLRERTLALSEGIIRGSGYIDEANRTKDMARLRAEKLDLAHKARENAVACGTSIALLEERRDNYNRQADRLFLEANTLT